MTQLDQPFASSEMEDSMDADLLPELSGETWVAAIYLDELTADFPATDSDQTGHQIIKSAEQTRH